MSTERNWSAAPAPRGKTSAVGFKVSLSVQSETAKVALLTGKNTDNLCWFSSYFLSRVSSRPNKTEITISQGEGAVVTRRFQTEGVWALKSSHILDHQVRNRKNTREETGKAFLNVWKTKRTVNRSSFHMPVDYLASASDASVPV